MNGLLITLEGIDGSGKTTALKMLQDRLAQSVPQRRFVFTAEPTNNEAGQILRARLSANIQDISTQDIGTQEYDALLMARKMEELFLFMADHSNQLASVIIPSLNAGNIVISDRYTDSTAAYQGVTLQGVVQDPVNWIINLCKPWDIKPNITLLFAIDPALALERIRSRRNREKFERLEFLREVDSNFRRIAALEQNRFIIIDAGRDIEDVAGEALSAILGVVCRYQH
ncbi:MAG: dTMP kinase [Methanotrichaceae archaeon]